jgi:hypothetical protein
LELALTFAGKVPATEPVVSFGLANMWFYALKRTGLAVVIVAVAVLLLFSLLHMIPGDPISIALGPRATPEIIERYTEKMHLNDPIVVQFFIFLKNAATGDLGVDVFSERSVALILGEQLPYTLILAVVGLGWAVLLGIPLGLCVGNTAKQPAGSHYRSVIGRHHCRALFSGVNLGPPDICHPSQMVAGHRCR